MNKLINAKVKIIVVLSALLVSIVSVTKADAAQCEVTVTTGVGLTTDHKYKLDVGHREGTTNIELIKRGFREGRDSVYVRDWVNKIKNTGVRDIIVYVKSPVASVKAENLFPDEWRGYVPLKLYGIVCVDKKSEKRSLIEMMQDQLGHASSAVVEAGVEVVASTVEGLGETTATAFAGVGAKQAANEIRGASTNRGKLLRDGGRQAGANIEEASNQQESRIRIRIEQEREQARIRREQEEAERYLNRLSNAIESGSQNRPERNLFRYFKEVSNYEKSNAYLTMLASELMDMPEFHVKFNAEYIERARSHYKQWGFKNFFFIEGAEDAHGVQVDTQSIVAANKDMVLVVFRGSEFGLQHGFNATVQDLSTSISVLDAKPGGNFFGGDQVKVVPGYANAAAVVLPRIKNILTLLGFGPDSRKPIFVTGHSLGGAVALMAAYNLKSEGYPVKAVYAHASPRVGFLSFKRKYQRLISSGNFEVHKIIHEKDKVPFFPIMTSGGYVNNVGDLHVIEGVYRDRLSVNEVSQNSEPNDPVDADITDLIKFHSGERYAHALYLDYRKNSSSRMPEERSLIFVED